jgi:hypothetical protein
MMKDCNDSALLRSEPRSGHHVPNFGQIQSLNKPRAMHVLLALDQADHNFAGVLS